ncbi:hypothetical protein D3C80_2056800 [compost metagenome]
MVLLEPLDQRGQYVDHGRCNRPDCHHAGVAGHCLMDRQLKSFQLISKLSDCGKDCGPSGGQLCAAA